MDVILEWLGAVLGWAEHLITEVIPSIGLAEWLPALIMGAAALAYLGYVMWRLHIDQVRSARLRAYIERRKRPDGQRAALEILEQARQRLEDRRRRRS